MLTNRAMWVVLALACVAMALACELKQATPLPPIAAPAPTPGSPSPSTSETSPGPVVVVAIPTPPDLDLVQLAAALGHNSPRATMQPTPRVANPQVGQSQDFWVTDSDDKRVRRITATLAFISPNAYWYVQDGASVNRNLIQQSIPVFEDQIVPTVVGEFGSPGQGTSTQNRITILHGKIEGVAGYFSGNDQYPSSVHPNSNERRMLYINTDIFRSGVRSYQATIAHELQHAVHYDADASEETWVNEGLSELAAEAAGYESTFTQYYAKSPGISITEWALESRDTPPNYAAAHLFFRYLFGHYGGIARARELVAEPLDTIPGVDAYLKGFNTNFTQVFKDWTVANLLGQSGNGRYAYSDNLFKMTPTRTLGEGKELEGRVNQFGVEYVILDTKAGDAVLTFQGAITALLLPTRPVSGESCWWGNRGDGIQPSITRELNLSGLSKATLRFSIWYDLEDQWDYAYIQVSSDGGKTWDLLESQHTSPNNPVGNSFGHGFTGKSNGWTKEEVGLSRYAGRTVLLRFQYVTDEALNSHGLCIDDISVPELNFSDDAESVVPGWTVDGFLRTNLYLPQLYSVQVVLWLQNGQVSVLDMLINAATSTGELRLEGFGGLVKSAAAVVSGLTQYTRVGAAYRLQLTP